MQNEEEKINIRLHIYDTEIPVRVPRNEEAFYRRGGTLINELLNAYNASFKTHKSDKEINYYVMIDLALRLEKELDRNDTKLFVDILSQLTAEIEETLKQSEK